MHKQIFFLIATIAILPFVFQDSYANTYTSSSPTSFGHVTDTDNDDVCNVGGSKSASNDPVSITTAATGNTIDCQFAYFEYDISTVPDDATIDSVSWEIDIQTATNPKNCDYNSMGGVAGSDTAANIFSAILSGTTMVDNNTVCTTTGDNKSISFGAVGITEVEAALAGDVFSFGVRHDDITLGGTDDFSQIDTTGGTPFPTLTIEYTPDNPPDAVDDLSGVDIFGSGVTLQWTTPNLQGETLSGYNINYTTPHADPLTIIVSNTLSSSTEYDITGLTPSTDYSFRVSALTSGGANATGNIYNMSTTAFAPANFTIGFINVNATNTSTLDILFDRSTLNTTADFVNVTYPNTYDIACNLHYKYANTDVNYTSLNSYNVTSTQNQTSFLFNGIENEIIDMYCYDQNTLNGANYLVTISDFPLLQQIEGFQNGEFGTAGKFGAFDFITFLVIIVSMIGFNRINESVGGIISIMILGATAYFGIITIPTVIFGVLAVVIMLIVTTTRKS